jgi:hypothetical protein
MTSHSHSPGLIQYLTNACTEIHEGHSLRHIGKTGKMYINMLDYPTTIPVTYPCIIIINDLPPPST